MNITMVVWGGNKMKLISLNDTNKDLPFRFPSAAGGVSDFRIPATIENIIHSIYSNNDLHILNQIMPHRQIVPTMPDSVRRTWFYFEYDYST